MNAQVRLLSAVSWTRLLTLSCRSQLPGIMLKCRLCISNKLPDSAVAADPWARLKEPGPILLDCGEICTWGRSRLLQKKGILEVSYPENFLMQKTISYWLALFQESDKMKSCGEEGSFWFFHSGLRTSELHLLCPDPQLFKKSSSKVGGSWNNRICSWSRRH